MADAGKVMIFPRGNYDSTSVYEVLDLVNHNNASWVAKKNTINGIEPSEANSEYWFKMAGHIVANNLNTSTEGYVLDARQGKILMDEVADAKSQIAQIANNQIPDEYLQASVDAYVAEYSGGFATQANVAEVKSDLGKLKDGELAIMRSIIDYGSNPYCLSNYLGWERYSTTKTRLVTSLIPTVGDTLEIETTNTDIQFALVDKDNTVLATWNTSGKKSVTLSEYQNGLRLWVQKNDKGEITDSEADNYMNSFTLTYSVTSVSEKIRSANDICYVSVDGNDNNDGTADLPFATVNHALKNGYRTILMHGGVYEQNVDLTDIHGTVKISALETDKTPVFVDKDRIKITNSTVYNGSIYVADVDNSLLSSVSYIFQDGVDDIRTEISMADRLPQQRGRKYRCTDTKIVRCDATTLSDAVSEMEADYKFFYDATNHKLYFSAPTNDFSNHPICCGTGATLFSGCDRSNTLIVTGIDCKYMRMNLDFSTNSVASYCKVSCAYVPTSGQYTWDDCVNIEFNSCEACLSSGEYTKNDGDGFNAHALDNVNDALAHRNGAKLINCWSHDNKDDGYSEHQRSESFIIGGLYEYNGKGGVTPSYGCHCECIGVISRYNYNGFVCCNGASNAEGGVGTQLVCIKCVAYGNNGVNTGYGFVCYSSATEPTHNTMLCVGCSAYNNLRCGYAIGQASSQTLDYGKLIDCKASNNGVSPYRAYGTIEIINNDTVVPV